MGAPALVCPEFDKANMMVLRSGTAFALLVIVYGLLIYTDGEGLEGVVFIYKKP